MVESVDISKKINEQEILSKTEIVGREDVVAHHHETLPQD
jgi:hypothetical protein